MHNDAQLSKMSGERLDMAALFFNRLHHRHAHLIYMYAEQLMRCALFVVCASVCARHTVCGGWV